MRYSILKRQKASTLLELMFTISIIAIAAAIALPSYQSIISTIRISSYTNLLHGALLLTRIEALKRGRSVTICRSNNANSASPGCAVTLTIPSHDTGWGEGWLIYVDIDNNKTYSPGDVLIQAQGKLINRVEDGSITPFPNRNRLSFNSTGQLFGYYMRFTVNRPTWDKDLSHDRSICIASGGRARVDRLLCKAN